MARYGNITGNMRRWRAVAVAACTLVVSAAALAAPEPYLLTEVGHRGAIRRGYYFPIRVTVQWTQTPGEVASGDASAAVIEVLVRQDLLHNVRLRRDVTIQPGRATIATLYARSVVDVSELEIELRDRGGRLLASAKPQSGGAAGWWTIEGNEAIVLAAGRSSMPRSGWAFGNPLASPIKTVEVAAADLPREWPGYDAVSLVVLGDLGPERLDASQVAALLDWVGRGGHLAILATAQLDTVLTTLGDRLPLAIGEYADSEFNPSVGAALRGAVAIAMEMREKPLPPSPQPALRPGMNLTTTRPMEWYAPRLDDLNRSLEDLRGRFLYRRSIEALPGAREAGWAVRWAHEAFDPLQVDRTWGRSQAGDIARGPWGLGTITLLGIDPASLAGSASGEARGVGWWHCLVHIPEIHAALVPRRVPDSQYSYSRADSLESILASRAINTILDDLSAGFGMTQGLFAAIAVALLLLVVLIGPADYFMLRRLKREPFTWITTPALIALACAAIYFAQDAVSYGTARVKRLSIIDAWSGAGQGVATSFTAIASNRGGRYMLEGLGREVFASPACWRPPTWFYRQTQAPASTIPVDVTPAGARVRSIHIPLENVRWMEERGPIPVPAFTGSVRFDEARDEVALDLDAPPGITAIVVGVWWNEKWYVHPRGEVDAVDGTVRGRVFPRAAGDAEDLERRRQPAAIDLYGWYSPTTDHGWRHDAHFQIPGHRHVESRLIARSPGVAAILIEVETPPRVKLLREGSPAAAEWEERQMIRLIVPAAPAEGSAEEVPR